MALPGNVSISDQIYYILPYSPQSSIQKVGINIQPIISRQLLDIKAEIMILLLFELIKF